MRLCAGEHKTEDIELLDHFESFPFGLSHFQKYAIEGIVSEKNVLVTAHTGSGKTLPAEFAITFLQEKEKK
jgi:superfamily II RNA helicase